VTLRLALTSAEPFLPTDVLERFREQQRTRITKGDELVLHCDEERTQGQNMKLAFARLQGMLDEAAVPPKERVISAEPPPRVKEVRKREKRQHSAKKARRRGTDD
jgi:ribosome-associated protein